jgi:threonine synthase
VKFDPGKVAKDWFKVHQADFFAERYAPFYSYLKTNPSLSLGEGQTSLLPSAHLKEKIGITDLWFKNETQNPTWTFKDRGTACSIQNALALGYERFGTLSSGNMGASVAAYGGRAGMQTFIMLKDNIAREKIEALSVYGAQAFKVYGDYGKLYNRLLEIGKDYDIYFSLSDDPLRVEGYKTLAFELFEQMQGQLPDYLAVPLGSGGLCRGILKGFEELRAADFTATIPKFIGVQAQGNSPTVDAFENGRERIEPFENSLTLDHVLENPYPPVLKELDLSMVSVELDELPQVLRDVCIR